MIQASAVVLVKVAQEAFRYFFCVVVDAEVC